MSNGPQQVSSESVGRTSQIISGALIMGIVMFGGVAFVVAKGAEDKVPMLAFIGIAFAGMNTVLRFIVPPIIVNAAKPKLIEANDADRMVQLAGLYQTKTIIAMAVLEGAALLNLIAYVVDQQMWSYGVVAFLLGVMAISFPSQGQFESWAEEMKRNLN